MKSLAKAVYTVAATLGLDTHWGNAPADQSLPYLVLRMQPALGAEHTFEDVFTETRAIRFQVFAATMEAAMGYLLTIEGTFIGATLALDTGRVLAALKGSDDCFLEPERATDGSEVWQGILDVEFVTQRNPGG